MSRSVRLVEVGARDGLQNEAKTLAPAQRIELIQKLAACGLETIEAGAFVSPKWVPQMAQSDQVLQAVSGLAPLALPVLVPNLRGLEDAIAAGAKEVAVFPAVSESFSKKNINATVAESMERCQAICETALPLGVKVRAYLSCVLGCPYEGAVDSARVADLTAQLLAMGCYEVSLGDTIGVGTPAVTRSLLKRVLGEVSEDLLAVHFHDTYGQALANVVVSLELGIGVVDCSVAGLGGCPYAKGASGNLASEDLVYMLQGMGLDARVDLDALARVGWWISDLLGHAPASKVSQALRGKQQV